VIEVKAMAEVRIADCRQFCPAEPSKVNWAQRRLFLEEIEVSHEIHYKKNVRAVCSYVVVIFEGLEAPTLKADLLAIATLSCGIVLGHSRRTDAIR
jgi:hypothetical protein